MTKEERIILEAIKDARKVQDYIWGRKTVNNNETFEPKVWAEMFQKRVDKINEINPINKHAKVELRKRVLQQAALSIRLLQILDKQEND